MLNDPTVTSHKSDSYVESNIDTAHGKGRSSILTVDRGGIGQSGGPGETSYVGTYKDMLGGDKNLKKVVDKDYDHRTVSRSESDFKKVEVFLMKQVTYILVKQEAIMLVIKDLGV